jgi:hypothetical protein
LSYVQTYKKKKEKEKKEKGKGVGPVWLLALEKR